MNSPGLAEVLVFPHSFGATIPVFRMSAIAYQCAVYLSFSFAASQFTNVSIEEAYVACTEISLAPAGTVTTAVPSSFICTHSLCAASWRSILTTKFDGVTAAPFLPSINFTVMVLPSCARRHTQAAITHANFPIVRIVGLAIGSQVNLPRRVGLS